MRPQVLEKNMDIEEYVREETGRKKKVPPEHEDGESLVKGKKRKRNDDVDRNIPPGASKGFVSVANLVVKKKKTKTRKFDHTLAEDDSTDMELQTNLMDTGRSLSASAAGEPKSKNKASLRKTRTTEPGRKPTTGSVRKKGKTKKSEPLTASQFSCKGNDDSDDIDIKRDISHSIREADQKLTPSSPELLTDSTPPDYLPATTSVVRPPRPVFSVPMTPPRQSALFPSDSSGAESRPIVMDSPVLLPKPTTPSAWSSSPKAVVREVIELTSSPSSLSPLPQSPPNYSNPCEPDREEPAADQSKQQSPLHAKGGNQDISWLLDEDEDEDPDIRIISSSPAVPRVQQSPCIQRTAEDDSVIEVGEVLCASSAEQTTQYFAEMPIVRNSVQSSPSRSSDMDIPESSFAIRPAGKRLQTRHAESLENAWERTCVASPPRRRLMRKDTEIIPRASTPPLHLRKPKKPLISIRHNPWLDGEAEHSGDEVSDGGSSHSEDDVESESDRQFLKDIPDTQVSPSYDQFHIYRQSLLTQAPGVQNLPNFANKPVRKGGSTNARERSRYRPTVSSSPPREDDEPDEYVFGSFVVADDADLTFD